MTVPVARHRTLSAAWPSWRIRVRRLPSWLLVAGFAAAVALLILSGRAGLVRSLYTPAALGIAVVLFARGPAAYLVFAWWLWHISPGVRRIVDYHLGGWDPDNPMSLAPFLVSAVAVIGILRHARQLTRPRLLPWVIAVGCVGYGYFVGLLRIGVMPATHALVAWLVPLLFGLYAAVEWRRYPETRAAVGRAFLWGSLVLAVYGTFQFIDPPDWDRLWMVSSGMYSVGRAFPYEVRVFSLVNAPLPFATILLAGLLIALSERGLVRLVAVVAGTVALLLSLVRSVWLAGAVGILVYVLSLPLRAARRALIAGAIAVVGVAAVPLAFPARISQPTVELITQRFLSLTDLDSDVSFQDRASFLSRVSDAVADNPLGHGLGSTGVSSTLGDASEAIRDFDNGVFAVLYALGWVGGAGFLISVALIAVIGLKRREPRHDGVAKAARAVAITSVVLCLGANVFEGVSAAVLWSFAGLLAAAHRWHAGNPGVGR